MEKPATPPAAALPVPKPKPASRPIAKPLVKPAPETKAKPLPKKPAKTEAEKSDAEKPDTKPIKVPASSELASQLESLHEKLDGLEKTADRLRRRTPSVFGRFVSDLAKLILVAAAVTIAWQAGWITQFLDWAASVDLSALEFWRGGAGE